MQVSTPVERTLTLQDYLQLTKLVSQQQQPHAGAETMQELLDQSDLVSLPEAPATLVTLHAQLLLEESSGRSYQLTLCWPHEARPAEGLVSVLSPVGAALLGLHVGALARWRTPGGHEGTARILAVLGRPEMTAGAGA